MGDRKALAPPPEGPRPDPPPAPPRALAVPTQILSPPERTSLECLRMATDITVGRLRSDNRYGGQPERTQALSDDVIELAARFKRFVGP